MPQVGLGDIETWCGFRLGRATRYPSERVFNELEELGCYYDEAVGWTYDEEIVVSSEDTITRWELDSRGLRVMPQEQTKLIEYVESLASCESSLTIAASEHIEHLRAKLRAENEAVNRDYHDRLVKGIRDGIVKAQDLDMDFTPPQNRQARRARARLAAKAEKRKSQAQPANVAKTYSSFGNPEEPVAKDVTQSEGSDKHRARQKVTEELYGGKKAFIVDSESGPFTPSRLLELGVYDKDGNIVKGVQVKQNIKDTGSGAEIMGFTDYEWLNRVAPGSCVRVTPGRKAIQKIAGLGSVNDVMFHVTVTLDYGGQPVKYKDVAVLANHQGLILGNGTMEAANVVIQYGGLQDIPEEHTGTMHLRRREEDGSLVRCSEDIPFTTRPQTSSACYMAAACVADGGTGRTEGSDSTGVQEHSLKADEMRDLTAKAEEVLPIGIMPETRRFPAWSQFNLELRCPKACTVGEQVLALPLEDDSLAPLDILIAPTLCKVDEKGMITVRGINPQTRQVSVNMLTKVCRFVIDPRVSGADIEFTTEEIMERIHVSEKLTADERAYLRCMINTRRRLFATTLGWAHGYKQNIETPLIDSHQALPPSLPMRNRPPAEWAAIKESIDKQLKQRIIEPCISPYNAMPQAVKKPDGTYRVVLDFRALNALTKRDVYPLPNIQANLAKLGKANKFTVVDLLMGFHQCELNEESKLKTAFGTPWGQFCYTRMPMGLTSSPSAFMRLVDATLQGLPPDLAVPYLDDIIIATCGTMEDHIDKVGEVFDKLVQGGFTVRCDKVHTCLEEVNYVGFLVGCYGTRPEPKKTAPILEMTCEQMQQDPNAPGRFAGMVAFYQKFIENASQMLQPFNELKRAGADHTLLTRRLTFVAAFAALKKALADVTALARPDYSKPFYIDVDAATVGGVGAALSQREVQEDPTTHKPLAFYSRRFNSAERSYPVRDQECMGLVEAVVEWRPYILGAPTIVRTDHKSLKWLMSCQHPDGSRVLNWALRIQEYGVEIQYIEGSKNVVPDCISRADRKAADETHASSDDTGGTAHTRLAETMTAKTLEYAEATSRMDRDKARNCMAHNMSAAMDNETATSDPVGALVSSIRVAASENATTATADDEEATSTMVAAQFERKVTQRVAALLLSESGNFVVESQGGETGLPSVQIPVGTQTGYVRDALYRYISRAYGQTVGKAIKDDKQSTVIYPDNARVSTADLAVVVVHVPDGAIPDNVQHDDATVNVGFSKLTMESAASLSDNEEAKFVHSLITRIYDTDESSSRLKWRFHKGNARACIRRLRHSAWQQARRSRVAAGQRKYAAQILHYAPMITPGSLGQEGTGGVSMPSDSAQTADVAVARRTEAVAECRVPSPRESKCGPAHCVSTEEFETAVGMLKQRLSKHPEAVVAVDLEGELGGPYSHVALVQVAVDAYAADENQLVYVFNTNRNRKAAMSTGPLSLRSILEDSTACKVFHHCRGDTSALFYDFRIMTLNVFDTALADCILTGRHYQSSRSLLTVLNSWLGEDAVNLTFKSTLTHVPKMFEVFPLPYHLFVYAYEDVTLLSKLYAVLKSRVDMSYISEITASLTEIRIPPRVLPREHPNFQPVTRVAIALADSRFVVCLRDTRTSRIRLPVTEIEVPTVELTHKALKQRASLMWASVMGKAPKHVAAAVTSQLRKPIRIADSEGDILLFMAYINNCVERLGDLKVKFAGTITSARSEVILRSRDDLAGLAAEVEQGHAAMFQHVAATAAMTERKTLGPETPVATSPEADQPGLWRRIKLNLSIKGSTVLASLGTRVGHRREHPKVLFNISAGPDGQVQSTMCVSPEPATAEVNVVTGKQITEQRAALILYDDRRAFAITAEGKTSALAWPSTPVLIGEDPRNAAIRAFDTFAGNSIRKGCDVDSPSRWSLAAEFGSKLNRYIREGLTKVGTFGNTVYYAVRFKQEAEPFGDSVSGLDKYEATFYAARAECNGFRIIPTLAKRHTHAGLVLQSSLKSGKILGDFSSFDVEAYKNVDVTAAATQVATATEASAGNAGDLSIAKSPDSGDTTAGNAAIPTVGEDPEFDALFEARIAIQLGELLGEDDGVEAYACMAKGTPQANDCDGIGAPPKYSRVTEADIASAQLDHPAVAPYVRYLQDKDISHISQEDRERFLKAVKDYHISESGVLCYQPKKNERAVIVLPPCFHHWALGLCHDRLGHSGVHKTFKNVRRRYIWGTHEEMLEDVKLYVRGCRACARSKLARHPVGEGHVSDVGNQPMEMLSVDVYKVGYASKTGEDTIISFADHFSRAVFAEARKGDPTSEEFCDTLLRLIIAHYGVPRVIRSDHASVLISKAVTRMYEVYGISMSAGSPYQHRSVGLVERWHSTLKRLFLSRRLATKSSNWSRYLPLVQLCFNDAVSETTGFSPFFVNHIRHARMPIDSMSTTRPHVAAKSMPDWVKEHLDALQVTYDATARTLKLNAINAKKRWDLKHDTVSTFKEGEQVLMIKGTVIDGIHPKRKEPTAGPFTVAKVEGRGNYKLLDARSNPLKAPVNISRLIPYPSRSERELDAKSRNLVKAILGHRLVDVPETETGPRRFAAGRKLVEYKLKFRGTRETLWRSAHFLKDAWPLVRAYREMLAARGITPPDAQLEPEATERGHIEQPDVTEDARTVPHFRTRHRPQEDATLAQLERCSPQDLTDEEYDALVEEHAHLFDQTTAADLSYDKYPEGTRVRVKCNGTWWVGRVNRTYVRRTSDNLPAERFIVVHFEAEDYSAHLYEYGLATAEVEKCEDCATSEVEPDPSTGGNSTQGTSEAPLPTCAKQMRNGLWTYGVVSTDRVGRRKVRMFESKFFDARELQSPHFETLRQEALAQAYS